jgi:hypothetical protein
MNLTAQLDNKRAKANAYLRRRHPFHVPIPNDFQGVIPTTFTISQNF